MSGGLNLDRFDFAILVITPDDVVVSRDIELQAPRDNVMFELGLFMGRLGRDRTFGVCGDSANMKLPSDLAGVSMARYDVAHVSEDLTAAIGVACHPIRQAIRSLGPIARTDTEVDRIAETYFQIELDLSGLAAEMHQEHAEDLDRWRQAAALFIRLCLWYQRSALDELMKCIKAQRPLRASVTQVRDLVTTGFAETISLLRQKPATEQQSEEKFKQAAKRVWRMADQVRDHGDHLGADD